MKNATLSIAPPSAGRIVAGLAGLALLSALIASQLEYSKKEYVDGFLQTQGGDLRIVAPARGIVTFSAATGAEVSADQPLAVIKNPENLVAGGTLAQAQQAALAGKRSSLTTELEGGLAALDVRIAALTAQRSQAETQVAQAQAEVITRERLYRYDEAEVARQRTLKEQGFVSATTLEKAEAAVLSRRGELQAAQRAVDQARTQVSAAHADLAAAQAQKTSQREQLTRELKSVDQATAETQRQDAVTIAPTVPGRVVAWAVNSGDAVEAGQLLAKVSPKGRSLEAVLLLPPTSAGRVHPGQIVSLQLVAYPYQTYGLVKARIERLEQAPVLTDETSLKTMGLGTNQMVVKATARIDDVPVKLGPDALRTGLVVRAAVETERKSFLAWMTWPLLKHFV
jgi:membrane fusion protein